MNMKIRLAKLCQLELRLLRSSAAGIGLLLLAGPAFGVSGVVEINHVCSLNTGCFPGDIAGYPVTITAGGSYRLTSNLIVPNENTDGIELETPNVTIDLNGFEIVSLGCVGATTNCTPSPGTGRGISISTSFTNPGVAVSNGTITGMGFSGIILSEQSKVTNMRVRWNVIHGIEVHNASIVSGNTVYENGLHGITCDRSLVTGNTVYGSGNFGIDDSFGSLIAGNIVTGNTDDGIKTGTGSTVSGNTVTGNGGDGISGVNSGLVQRNLSYFNTGIGLNLGTGAAYRENVMNSNGGGNVTGGVNMLGNSCNGTTTCP